MQTYIQASMLVTSPVWAGGGGGGIPRLEVVAHHQIYKSSEDI